MEQENDKWRELFAELLASVERLESNIEYLGFNLGGAVPPANSLLSLSLELFDKLCTLMGHLVVILAERKDDRAALRLKFSEIRSTIEDAHRAIYPLTFKTDINGMVNG